VLLKKRSESTFTAGLYAILDPIPLFMTLCFLLCGLAFGSQMIEYFCMAITIVLLFGLCVLG